MFVRLLRIKQVKASKNVKQELFAKKKMEKRRQKELYNN